MISNTENNSASDKVNTRPRWKAYLDFMSNGFKKHQQTIALVAGYMLVASLFYNLGQFTVQSKPPEIRIEEPAIDLTEVYNNLKSAGAQLSGSPQEGGQVAGATTDSDDLNCEGKIKGNIGSSGKIYHLPGGASYKQTVAELCFDTEAEAQAAGFRKSKR